MKKKAPVKSGKQPAQEKVPNAVRDSRGKFVPGSNAWPSGRPKGSRSAVIAGLDALAEGRIDAIMQKMLEMAAQGDSRASALVLSKMWPDRKDGRPLNMTLPKIESIADLPAAQRAVAVALQSGRISGEDATSLNNLLQNWAKLFEVSHYESRIAALEKAYGVAPRDTDVDPPARLRRVG